LTPQGWQQLLGAEGLPIALAKLPIGNLGLIDKIKNLFKTEAATPAAKTAANTLESHGFIQVKPVIIDGKTHPIYVHQDQLLKYFDLRKQARTGSADAIKRLDEFVKDAHNDLTHAAASLLNMEVPDAITNPSIIAKIRKSIDDTVEEAMSFEEHGWGEPWAIPEKKTKLTEALAKQETIQPVKQVIKYPPPPEISDSIREWNNYGGRGATNRKEAIQNLIDKMKDTEEFGTTSDLENLLKDDYQDVISREELNRFVPKQLVDELRNDADLLNDLLSSYKTEKGQKFLADAVGNMKKNLDGTITIYRSGEISGDPTRVRSFTTSEGRGKAFSHQGNVIGGNIRSYQELTNQGRDFNKIGPLGLEEYRIQPNKIMAYNPSDDEILAYPIDVIGNTKNINTWLKTAKKGDIFPVTDKVSIRYDGNYDITGDPVGIKEFGSSQVPGFTWKGPDEILQPLGFQNDSSSMGLSRVNELINKLYKAGSNE
jgi:hypothetical protein